MSFWKRVSNKTKPVPSRLLTCPAHCCKNSEGDNVKGRKFPSLKKGCTEGHIRAVWTRGDNLSLKIENVIFYLLWNTDLHTCTQKCTHMHTHSNPALYVLLLLWVHLLARVCLCACVWDVRKIETVCVCVCVCLCVHEQSAKSCSVRKMRFATLSLKRFSLR